MSEEFSTKAANDLDQLLNTLADARIEATGDVFATSAEYARQTMEGYIADHGDQGVEGAVELIKCLTVLAEARRAAANKLLEKAKRTEADIEALRYGITRYLGQSTRVIHTTFGDCSMVSKGGKQPMDICHEWLDDPSSAPAPFQKMEVTLDKEAIRAHLANIGPIVGASLQPRETTLRIK